MLKSTGAWVFVLLPLGTMNLWTERSLTIHLSNILWYQYLWFCIPVVINVFYQSISSTKHWLPLWCEKSTEHNIDVVIVWHLCAFGSYPSRLLCPNHWYIEFVHLITSAKAIYVNWFGSFLKEICLANKKKYIFHTD